ncbi:MAG: hypothetical protein ABIP54_03955 [Candidatus Andersenbacteria bacterium]
MKTIKQTTSISALFLAIIVSLFNIQNALAANTITVTPSVARIDLQRDSAVTQIYYFNDSKETVTLGLSVKNFTALEDGFKVKFLNSSSDSLQYSLASWIHLGTNTLILSPGERNSVKIFIDKENLSPGGHYASIIAEIKQDNAPKTLGLTQAISSLLFVRGANGPYASSATINDFSLFTKNGSFPERSTMRFNNTGNVELVPYGEVTISNWRGKTVAHGIVNTESLITLPENIRSYSIPIEKRGTTIWPGYFTAKIQVHFDGHESSILQEKSFFSFGSFSVREIIYGFILLVLIIFIIRRLLHKR